MRVLRALSRIRGKAAQRLGWGVADQAVSSLTNFAVVIWVARSLGAVQFGAFSLAYVTYGFALNGSRGLAAYPLQVRFSGVDTQTWRRAVAGSTGTAAVAGLVSAACVLAVAPLLHGPTRSAFLGLGLTLPGLLLQDSWRYAFFVLGRGSQAFLNDLVWAAGLVPALLFVHAAGERDVFWFVLAWGAAAALAAAMGPLQARVLPALSQCRYWVTQHRDLGLRYVASGLTGSASIQLRAYGVSLILGLAAVGYVQAAGTLMGPFMIVFYGIGLVTVPEAARLLRSSPRRLPLFCALVSCGLGAAALVWGIALLIALPRGVGELVLGSIWRPTYPLVIPQVLFVIGQGISAGAATGLGALGAARRSLFAMILGSTAYLICGLVGAAQGGAAGTVRGTAIAAWLGVLVLWWQLRAALRESVSLPDSVRYWPGRPPGRHRTSPVWQPKLAAPRPARQPVPRKTQAEPGSVSRSLRDQASESQ